MSVIIKQGDQLRITDLHKDNTFTILPKGVYLLNADQIGFFLVQKEEFQLPKKIYGDHSIVNRWLTSWKETSKNMGINLTGIKGSGKTITAQKLCIDSELPVIMINTSFKGPGFVDWITNPALGECIVFIDEFEKVYNLEEDSTIMDSLLSIMDGQYPTRLLFLFTMNKSRVSEYLINRLGRIKYRKHYNHLEEDVIEEVIEDLLINKDHKDSIYRFLDILGMCTFDILTYMIREMNLFNEDALVCAKHLNLEIEPQRYNIIHMVDGKVVDYGSREINNEEDIEIYRSLKIDDDLWFEDGCLTITQSDIASTQRLENGVKRIKYLENIQKHITITDEKMKDKRVVIGKNEYSVYNRSDGSKYYKVPEEIETEIVLSPYKMKLLF